MSKEELIQYVAVALAVLLQPLGLWAIRAIWPNRDATVDRQQEDFLRQRLKGKVVAVDTIVTLLTWILFVLAPVGGYLALRARILANGQPGDVVLFHGFMKMAIFLAVGGALVAVASAPLIIRVLYRTPERDAMLWLFARGERREGAAGRYLIRRASRVSLGLFLVPWILWGNEYTVVGKARVEVAVPARLWARRSLPVSTLRQLSMTRRGEGKRSVCAVFADGTSLDNTSQGDGRLDGLGKQSVAALELLSRASGLPILEVSPGAEVCSPGPVAPSSPRSGIG